MMRTSAAVQARSDYFKHFMNSVTIAVGSTLLGLLVAPLLRLTVKDPSTGGLARQSVYLPAGKDVSQTVRLKGRGLQGTPAGDQIVTLQVVTPPAASESTTASNEA